MADPPEHAFAATSFAEQMAQEYVARGGDAKDLFAALAGIVSARDAQLAADALLSLEKITCPNS